MNRKSLQTIALGLFLLFLPTLCAHSISRFFMSNLSFNIEQTPLSHSFQVSLRSFFTASIFMLFRLNDSLVLPMCCGCFLCPLCDHSCMLHCKKIEFSFKDFFSKCDQIHKKLRIWSHLLKKSLMGNFIFVLCKIFLNFRNFPFKLAKVLFNF